MSSSPSSARKKTAYRITAVDRSTRCIIGWAVVWARRAAVLQQLLDTPTYAATYDLDGYLLYQAGIYPGTHQPGKTKVKPTQWKPPTPSSALIWPA